MTKEARPMTSAQFEGTPAGIASIGMGKEDEETSTDAAPWSYDSLRHRSPKRQRIARESPTRRAGAAILRQLPMTSTTPKEQNGIYSPPTTATLASHASISRTGFGNDTNLASVSPFEAAHSLLLLTSSAPVVPFRQEGSVVIGSEDVHQAVTNDDDDGIADANEDDDGAIVGADMVAGTPIGLEAKKDAGTPNVRGAKAPSIAVARQVTPSFGSPSRWSLSGRDLEYRKKMIVNM